MLLFSTGEMIFAVFLLVTIVQLFYYLYFFIRLSFFKPALKKDFQQHPVSVVVCGKNESKNWMQHVPLLARQQYQGSYELVVVNDGSTDDSSHVLTHLQQQYSHLRVVDRVPHASQMVGKKYPLAAGINTAAHELLLLTDADCMPASNLWLQKMQHAYQQGIDVVLGYGAYAAKAGLLNKLVRFETFHTALQYFSYALAGIPYMGVGRNLSYTKTAFLKNNGFETISHLPGGDDDLFIKEISTATNTAIVIDKDAFTISTPPQSWAAWMHQKKRHYSTARYYKPVHQMLLGLYSASHFCFYVLLAATIFWYDWKWALLLYGVRGVVQWYIFSKSMKKLHEQDLIYWLPLLDLWMFVYYLTFAPALFATIKKKW